MLEGVVPFPPEFAARYRAKGYWEDRSLAVTFQEVCARYADRVAIVNRDVSITYAQLDERAARLALNLLDAGLKPLDRVVVQLPNVVEFACLYFALQKIGCIPVMALVSHRYLEISQFVELTGAVACVAPDRHRDFDFTELIGRIRRESHTLQLGIVLGDAPAGFLSLGELLARPPRRLPEALRKIAIDPTDPALFLLSGGTTGVPKLIPRTHNDYVYNSKTAVSVCDVGPTDVLLDILPIGHNLPLACPGLQGFLLKGARVVLDTGTRAEHVFRLVERHRVTHIHLVPALLIQWINDPHIKDYDLSSLRVLQSGGQRLQPEVRRRTEALLPGAKVQENFGMSEGVLMFVRLDDPEDVRLETEGRPMSPDDEVRLVEEQDEVVAPGEIGELCCRGPYTIRGYFRAEEYNRRAFTTDGFYRSGDLMRQHPSGNYIVEGRKKDLINRGGEKISAEEVENLILSHPAVHNVACIPMPDLILGERMCACVTLRAGARLDFAELVAFLAAKGIAKHKLPERLEIFDELPVSTFGKIAKKALVERVSQRAPQGAPRTEGGATRGA
jgi:2,3-dihydroxybenzoate-AMP ligase